MNNTIVNFYIDGFNIYHRVNNYLTETGICYKWLDYSSLCKSTLREGEELGDIYFFTAITTHRGNKSVDRHNKYILALQNQGIKVIHGYFKPEDAHCKVKTCNSTNKTFSRYVEKQTDVNLSLQMLEDAFLEKANRLILLSGDSDHVPALVKINNLKPEIKLGLITPPYLKERTAPKKLRPQKISNLRKQTDFQINLTFDKLVNHLLPDTIITKDNRKIIKPSEYN